MIENIATKIGTRGAYTNELTGFAAVALYLQDSKPAVQFKALTTTVTEQSLLQSVENKNNIYFTPEGIMIGGFLIAEPNNPDVWAKKTDVLRLQSTLTDMFESNKAMKFAGVISSNGNVNQLSDELAASNYFVSETDTPEELGAYASNSASSIEFFEDEETRNVSAIDITGVALYIRNYILDSGNPSSARIQFKYPGASIQSPYNEQDQYQTRLRIVYHDGGIDHGTTTAIDKEITLPYAFTQNEINAILNMDPSADKAYIYTNANYGGTSLVDKQGGGRNEIDLYLKSLQFKDISKYIKIETGCVFISQFNGEVVPGKQIGIGDQVIMTTTVQNRSIAKEDFVVIAGYGMAGRTNPGYMSAAHYNKLEDMDPSAYLTSSDLPIFDTNDSNNATGVAKTSSGLVKAKLSIGTVTRTPAQVGENNNGLALCIEAPSGDRVGSVTDLPYAASNAWGVVRVDGSTIIADSDGVISATANLTWS